MPSASPAATSKRHAVDRGAASRPAQPAARAAGGARARLRTASGSARGRRRHGGAAGARRLDARRRRQQARACSRARGAARMRATGPRSTMRPSRITSTSSASAAITPMSCVTTASAMPRSRIELAQQREDLRLHRHVERRGRLVGDQQFGIAGQRHGDHGALAHAARQLVRILAQAARHVVHAHLLEQLSRRARAPRASSCPDA